MKQKTNVSLQLSSHEKQKLREHKIRQIEITNFAVDELEAILNISFERAREILALAEFQSIPSIGIKFAQDLIFSGYYTIEDLKGKDAATLTDEYELKKGFWIDPCVEDQFRLVVHYANTHDHTKRWWDFTGIRKQYRLKNAYPANRPHKAWYEIINTK